MPQVKLTTPKIMFLDIEATNLDANFGRMLTFAWRFLGAPKSYSLRTDVLCKDPLNDGPLTALVAQALAEADVWVSWYGARYDIPYIQSRMFKHNLGTLPPIPHIDLWKTCRYKLKLNNNRLETAARFLGCNTKTHLDGDIWQAAGNGQKWALDYIEEHNIEDVVMLEKVYLRMRPLIATHPNVNLRTGKARACPSCGSTSLQKRGHRLAKSRLSQRYQCLKCTTWSHGPTYPVDGVEVR